MTVQFLATPKGSNVRSCNPSRVGQLRLRAGSVGFTYG